MMAVSGAANPHHLDVIVAAEIARGNHTLGWRGVDDRGGASATLRFAGELDLEAITAEFDIPLWLSIGAGGRRTSVLCQLTFAEIVGTQMTGKVQKRAKAAAWWAAFDPAAGRRAVPLPATYTAAQVQQWVGHRRRDLASHTASRPLQ